MPEQKKKPSAVFGPAPGKPGAAGGGLFKSKSAQPVAGAAGAAGGELLARISQLEKALSGLEAIKGQVQSVKSESEGLAARMESLAAKKDTESLAASVESLVRELQSSQGLALVQTFQKLETKIEELEQRLSGLCVVSVKDKESKGRVVGVEMEIQSFRLRLEKLEKLCHDLFFRRIA